MNILSSSSESCPEYPTESIIYQLLHRCPMKNQPQWHYLLPLINGERAGEWERWGRNKCKRCASLLKLFPNKSKTRASAPQNPWTISSVARMQRWTLIILGRQRCFGRVYTSVGEVPYMLAKDHLSIKIISKLCLKVSVQPISSSPANVPAG